MHTTKRTGWIAQASISLVQPGGPVRQELGNSFNDMFVPDNVVYVHVLLNNARQGGDYIHVLWNEHLVCEGVT